MRAPDVATIVLGAVLAVSLGAFGPGLTSFAKDAADGKPLPAWKKGVVEGTVEIEGAPEKFVALVPAGYSPKKPVATVLLLHGNGGTAARFLEVVRTFLGKTPPLLVSLERCDNQQQAIGYAPKYLAALRTQFAIRDDLVFALGFSGGGFRLWDDVVCKAEEAARFRGVVVVGAGRQSFDPPEKPSPAPTVILVGDPKDPNFTEAGPAAERALAEKGYETIVLEHGAGHSMPPPELKDVFGWIDAVVAGKKPTLVSRRRGSPPPRKG